MAFVVRPYGAEQELLMYHHRQKVTIVLFSFLGLFFFSEKILNFSNDFVILLTVVHVVCYVASAILAAVF